MTGHVFVVRGDLTKLSCDALLVPTDEYFEIESLWSSSIPDGAIGSDRFWEPGQRVQRLEAGSSIWLGNIGIEELNSDGVGVDWYSEGVAEFVRKAGSAVQQERSSHRPPFLAVNHVGTGQGGGKHTKGQILEQLFTVLQTTVRESAFDIDIAVVSFDEHSHAAAQRARLRVLGGAGPDALETATRNWGFSDPIRAEALRIKAEELASESHESLLAVFMGAGVSTGAGLPNWADLLQGLGQSLDSPTIADDLNLLGDPRDQAALLDRRFAAKGLQLREELCSSLHAGHYSLQHGLLSSLPVREFTTTNFDELFEQAARTNDRLLRVLPVSNLDDAVVTDRWLLKLHGTISDPSSIILTRSSYIDAPRQRGALFGLVQAMLMTRHMLFVGYGLRDEDFHELIHEVRYARTPSPDGPDQPTSPTEAVPFGTALTLFDDPIHAELWSGDVDVVPMFSACPSPGPTDFAEAGREVEIFLDLLGLLTADRSGFLLNEQYAGMLTEDEKRLRDLLMDMHQHALGDKRDGWKEVSNLLKRFGAVGRPDAGP
jgi:hypothetical protein